MKSKVKYILPAGILVGLCMTIFLGCSSKEAAAEVPEVQENREPIAIDMEEKEEVPEEEPSAQSMAGINIMGFMARDVSEVLSQSPLTGREDEITELPVFVNPAYSEYTANDYGIHEEDYEDIMEYKNAILAQIDGMQGEVPVEMLEMAEEIQRIFGLEGSYEDSFQPSNYGAPHRLYRKGQGYYIDIESSGKFFIDFDSPIKMDTLSETFDSQAFADYFTEYLYPYLKEFLGFEKFEKNITWNYNIFEDKHYWIEIYPVDESLSLEEQFLLYEFNKITLYPDYKGEDEQNLRTSTVSALSGLRGYKDILGEGMKVLERYPIISKEQAEEEFKKGNYLSASYLTEDELALGVVQGAELIYLDGNYYENLLPVYQLYVTFGEETGTYFFKEEPIEKYNNYGIFYVPAVVPEYAESLDYKFYFN